MTRVETKTEAIQLRKAGYSYTTISEKLSIPRSTLSNWLQGIPFTPNKETVRRIGDARTRAAMTKARSKRKTFEEAALRAHRDIRSLSSHDMLMLGIGLYIGEGEKNENVGIINSNPKVIKLAIAWLKEVCGVQNKNLTLAIHLYPDNNMTTCLQYWSDETGIPLSQFGKTQIDKRKGKRMGKRRKLPYGTAHLRVKSKGNKQLGVVLSRTIHAWMDRVTELRA